MSDERTLNDPTNHIVCNFADRSAAVEAKEALIKLGYGNDEVQILCESNSEIDTTAKWFADTDVELKKFERELREGAAVLVAPVRNSDEADSINQVLQSHDANHVTHFGDWTTKVMR